MMEKKYLTMLKELVENLVTFGRKNGADEIEVSVADGSEFSVDVRLGKIESLVEAGSRHVGLKVIKDQKTAFGTSSDLRKETLQNLVKNAETVGTYFLEKLKDSVETYPFLGEARGLGLFLGIEVVKDKQSRTPDPDLAKKIKNGLKTRGHLVGVTGNYSCVLRITPPLIVTREHVDRFIRDWKETLDTL